MNISQKIQREGSFSIRTLFHIVEIDIPWVGIEDGILYKSAIAYRVLYIGVNFLVIIYDLCIAASFYVKYSVISPCDLIQPDELPIWGDQPKLRLLGVLEPEEQRCFSIFVRSGTTMQR